MADDATPGSDAPDDAQEAPSDGPEHEPFDPERARAALKRKNSEAENLRRRLKELEPLALRAQELEDGSKSETEKLTETNRSLEQRAVTAEADALRLRIALRRGLSEVQAKRLVGSTEEELDADAEELLASFKTPDAPGGRPREHLRPGAVPDAEPVETDPAKLAALVPRNRF